jgi:citrate synthase
LEKLHWDTALSYTTEDGIYIRGYDLNELVGSVPFPSVLYLLYTGTLPQPYQARLIEAVMVASIDHGAGTPSVLAARTAASGGAGLGPAAAAGLLTLGKYHGAAVQGAMEAIYRVADLAAPGTSQLADAAAQVVKEWRNAGKRISGFGHRQHKDRDPRLDRLMAIAREEGVHGQYLNAANELESALHRTLNRPLPINIDGGMAAILLEIDFPIGLSNALFMVSRMTGILAHAYEEIDQMTPMRRIDPLDHGYCGPEPRSIHKHDEGMDHD